MQVVQSKDQVVILAMNWIQKYKIVIDMNKEWIIFQVDRRKFTTKLILNTKSQNKVYYYTISKSEDIINLTLTEDNITEVIEGDDKGHPIMIESEKDSILSNSKTKMIPENLKGKFLDEVIASYKNKCKQYIE